MDDQINMREFLIQFQDYVAPRLDTYEQAVYLYIFRHSRLIGLDEVTLGFQSARYKIASGTGAKGHAISQKSIYSRLDSLVKKGLLERIATLHSGTRVRLRLPSEVAGVVPASPSEAAISLEQMDFFSVPENRSLIVAREQSKCFYCLRTLKPESCVIEHVNSRPEGGNSYRNVVAACRQCNNRKGPGAAEDLLRTLYRDGFLADSEFEGRLSHLQQLAAGLLRPAVAP